MSPWKIVCLLAFLLLVGLAGWGGERGWAWATGRFGSPGDVDTLEDVALVRSGGGLRFGEPEYRVQSKATTIRHEFPFTNESSSSITITKVRTSCGRCSSGKPVRDVCAPGERGVIVLEVDAQGQAAGPKGYSATVEYLDPEPREARLSLVVDYEPEVEIIPSALTLTLTAGKTATGRFRIFDSRAEPFRSKRFTTSMKAVRVTAVGQEGGRTIQEFEVAVDDSRELPLGRTTAHIVIHSEGGDSQARSLPVTVEKVPRVRVAPSPLYLKRTAGEGAAGKIVVTDVEGEEVALEKVEASGGAVQVSFDREARPRPIIAVQTRNAAEVRFPITIRITVVRPCRQEVVVTIAGLSS